jgi:ankyrin
MSSLRCATYHPAGKATAPTRVTCKLVKREKASSAPSMMEGEALATRIIEMGPPGAKFQGYAAVD